MKFLGSVSLFDSNGAESATAAAGEDCFVGTASVAQTAQYIELGVVDSNRNRKYARSRH
jgi:hypothetical protein